MRREGTRMTSTSVRFVWQISVTKDHFTSINQATEEVCKAVPGVSGEVVGDEKGGMYHFAVPSTEEDRSVVEDALTAAGIPAKIRLLRPA